MNTLSLETHWTHSYVIECRDKDGILKWKEVVPNIVMDVGANNMLTEYYTGSAYTAVNYIGLTTGTPTFATGDTMASHAGWTEYTAYSQATRPAPAWGTAASRSLTTTAAVVFSINGAGGTVGGAFLTTVNTIGGTTGTLIGGAAFSANRTVASGDTVNVTPTASV